MTVGGASSPEGGGQSTWRTFASMALEALPAIVGAVGFVGFVALIGGAIQWTRFWAAKLPADQAVRVIPETELVTVGAVSTTVFVLLGLVAVLIVFLLDPRGNVSTGTRRGLLIVVGIELAAAVTIVDLRWWETLLFIVWALVAAIAAFRPIEYLAAVLGPRLGGPDPDGEDPRLKAERKRFKAAREDHAEARDAWKVARERDRPAFEREAAEDAWRRAEDAWAVADRRWRRVQAEHGKTPPDDVPAERPPSWRPTRWDALAAAILLGGLAMLLWFDAIRWLLIVLLVPLVLYLALLGIARATTRFAWYGVAVFLSVPLFGGVLAVADVLHTPQVQPMALVRKSDDHALCGVYVTQTDDRIYVGRVELDPDDGSNRRAQPETGRIFSVPMEDVDVASVGPLQRIKDAQRHAIDLLDEVYADRAEEPATAVENPVTVSEDQTVRTEPAESEGAEPTTTTTKDTTTTEMPARAGRPSPRDPPSDHPPSKCTDTDLD